MKDGMSLYRCDYCGTEVKAAPATKRGCPRCNQPMKEVVPGIVQKGPDVEKEANDALGDNTNKVSAPLTGEDVKTMPYEALKVVAKDLKVQGYGIMKEDKLRETILGLVEKREGNDR